MVAAVLVACGGGAAATRVASTTPEGAAKPVECVAKVAPGPGDVVLVDTPDVDASLDAGTGVIKRDERPPDDDAERKAPTIDMGRARTPSWVGWSVASPPRDYTKVISDTPRHPDGNCR
jgi:hypothetical protein